LLVSTAKAAAEEYSDDEELVEMEETDDEDGEDVEDDGEEGESLSSAAAAAQVEAAAVHVQSGHFDDTIPGLAHFHERTYVECKAILYLYLYFCIYTCIQFCTSTQCFPFPLDFLFFLLADMLFLGTEKYPSEDEYEGFLSKYGGLCNAYTDM
jgi:Insulinase (Peptidase family M16)